MRTLHDHKLPGLNEALEIYVMDEPGQGGACHEYQISVPGDEDHVVTTDISFQNGPIKEAGINGISGEALIAINIDRLRCFQAGPYASADNADALQSLENALFFLQKRTKERLSRGVEGTNRK